MSLKAFRKSTSTALRTPQFQIFRELLFLKITILSHLNTLLTTMTKELFAKVFQHIFQTKSLKKMPLFLIRNSSRTMKYHLPYKLMTILRMGQQLILKINERYQIAVNKPKSCMNRQQTKSPNMIMISKAYNSNIRTQGNNSSQRMKIFYLIFLKESI